MKRALLRIACLVAVGVLAGCAPIIRQAVVADGWIENPQMSPTGFRFRLPGEFSLYEPGMADEDLNELQQMAVRVYRTNEEYSPLDNELFYESFLFLGERSCFLLVTVKYDAGMNLAAMLPSDRIEIQHRRFPLYNLTDRQRLRVGGQGAEAVLSQGRAWERKGWFHAAPRRGRMEFDYVACKATGFSRDGYILLGFALPGDRGLLDEQMQELIGGLEF